MFERDEEIARLQELNIAHRKEIERLRNFIAAASPENLLREAIEMRAEIERLRAKRPTPPIDLSERSADYREGWDAGTDALTKIIIDRIGEEAYFEIMGIAFAMGSCAKSVPSPPPSPSNKDF